MHKEKRAHSHLHQKGGLREAEQKIQLNVSGIFFLPEKPIFAFVGGIRSRRFDNEFRS